MFLIRADSLTKLPRNYNLISRHQMKSSMPFHINNLTPSETLPLKNTSEERILELALKYRKTRSFCTPWVKRRRLELLMRAFTLGARSGPLTSQQPFFLQKECDIIIKLEIVSLTFSHYDQGPNSDVWAWGQGLYVNACDEEGQAADGC